MHKVNKTSCEPASLFVWMSMLPHLLRNTIRFAHPIYFKFSNAILLICKQFVKVFLENIRTPWQLDFWDTSLSVDTYFGLCITLALDAKSV